MSNFAQNIKYMTAKKTNLGYKITIILLSAIILFLVYDKISTKKDTVEMITVIEETSQEKDSLRNELQDLYLAYADLETNNSTIKDSLNAQQTRIKELMDELKNVKGSDYSRINQLKEEVETLKKIMRSYVKQIDSLYQQNQVLIAENTQIKTQYQDQVTQTEQLTTQNDSLKETIQAAKELTVYSTSLIALNQRGKATERINKTERFQICFLLSENKVAQQGRKNIFIRVTKPDGEVLRNDNSGFFNYQGESIAYSSVKEIEYDGTSQNICMFYLINTEDLPEGNYTVFIFADGRQIGDKKITLK